MVLADRQLQIIIFDFHAIAQERAHCNYYGSVTKCLDIFFYLCEHLRLLPYRFLLRPIIEGHQQTQQIIMIVSPERMRRFFMLILFLSFLHRLDNFCLLHLPFTLINCLCISCAVFVNENKKPWQERPVAPSKQRENFTRELKISTKKAIWSRKKKARQKKGKTKQVLDS